MKNEKLHRLLEERDLGTEGKKSVLVARLQEWVSSNLPPPPLPSAKKLKRLKVTDLQALLTLRGLAKSGKKAELIARLQAFKVNPVVGALPSSPRLAALSSSVSSPLPSPASAAVTIAAASPEGIPPTPDSDAEFDADSDDADELAAESKAEIFSRLKSIVRHAFLRLAYKRMRQHEPSPSAVTLRAQQRSKRAAALPAPLPPPPPVPAVPTLCCANCATSLPASSFSVNQRSKQSSLENPAPLCPPCALQKATDDTRVSFAPVYGAPASTSTSASSQLASKRLHVSLSLLGSLRVEDIVRSAKMIESIPPSMREPIAGCFTDVNRIVKRFDGTLGRPISDDRRSRERDGAGVLLVSFMQWLMWAPLTLPRHPSQKEICNVLLPRIARFRQRDFLGLHDDFVQHSKETRKAELSRDKSPSPEAAVRAKVARSADLGALGEWSKCLGSIEAESDPSRNATGLQIFTSKAAQAGSPVGVARTPLTPMTRADPAVRRIEREAIARSPRAFNGLAQRLEAKFPHFKDYLRSMQPHTSSDAMHVDIDWFKSFLYAAPGTNGASNKSGPLGKIFHTVARVAEGRIPERAKELLAISSGMILAKQDGGWRPICITGIFSKLASGTLLRPLRKRIIAECESVGQLGNSVAGCETVGHAVRALLEADILKCIAALDVKNAFGSISRQCIIDGLREVAPELIPYVLDLYARVNLVVFWREDQEQAWSLVEMLLGVRQGCTFASLLFCLALIPYVRKLRAEFGCDEPDAKCHVLLICDDIFIVGYPANRHHNGRAME